MDTSRPDAITDSSVSDYTIRIQEHHHPEHGTLYHVCLMTREGSRVGPWVTTNDADQADNHAAFLEMYAMIESGKV